MFCKYYMKFTDMTADQVSLLLLAQSWCLGPAGIMVRLTAGLMDTFWSP